MCNKLSRPLTEHDIQKHWKYKEKVYISCICTTYNQSIYIKDAIDGFLAQQTEYCFEVIIYDDASNDGTQDILLEYQNKYPSIIKLILQKENQYSQGKRVIPLAVNHAKGIYVALCEGDDFWIDKFKLQKQIIELETNKDINLVISKAKSLYPDNSTLDFCDLGHTKKIIPFESCILGPRIDYFPTASFFLRKKIFNELPDWFCTEAPVGDYYIQLFAAKYNGVIYLPDITSIYRRNAIGSWTSHKDKNKKFDYVKKSINCYLILMVNDLKVFQRYIFTRLCNQSLEPFLKGMFIYGNKIENLKLFFKLIINHPYVCNISFKIITKNILRIINEHTSDFSSRFKKKN